jgi:uncharacterized surface protein with fasciclin (FAS1) repeats
MKQFDQLCRHRMPLCLAAAVAVAVLATTPARADTLTTTQTTTTVTSAPAEMPIIMPPPLGPNGQPIDYTVLVNSPFDYTDLCQAHAEGFSDREIAVIAKISAESGAPFEDIAHEALAGQSFPTIADRYNLRLYDVLDASDYQDKIRDYKAAYRNTGANDVKNLVASEQQEMYTSPYGTTVTSTETSTTSGENLAAVINNQSDLTMFARALRTARVMKVLRGPGPYTVFAPNDAAWSKLSSDQVNSIFANRGTLTRMVNSWIIPRHVGRAEALAMTQPASVTSLEGDPLTFTSTSDGTLMVNGATVVTPDIFASNGVVQEIDTVLIPSDITGIPGVTGAALTNNYTTITPSTTLAPSTTVAPNSTTSVSPNGTSTTITPNGTTTVEPNGTTTVSPNGLGGTTVSPSPNGGTTVTPQPVP